MLWFVVVNGVFRAGAIADCGIGNKAIEQEITEGTEDIRRAEVAAGPRPQPLAPSL
jgi:hypothetical protein